MLDKMEKKEVPDVQFEFEGNGDNNVLMVCFVFHSFCCTCAGANDLNEILSLLAPTSHKFNQLGRGLNLDGNVMERIIFEARKLSSYEALTQVLSEWLKWKYPYQKFGKPSLSLLVRAIDTYDHPLAVKVFETLTAAAGEYG